MQPLPPCLPVKLPAVEKGFQKHVELPEMTSLLNQSGLNFQNGNPLGRKVRALETTVEELRKEINALKAGGVAPSGAVSAAPSAAVASTLSAELDALKRDMAMIKLAGFGKGEKGDKGDRGDKGEKGEPGPMTYIAMPASAALPASTSVAAPSVP